MQVTFWEKFLELRKKLLPIDSNIYEMHEQFYFHRRRKFELDWKDRFATQLPESTRKYYNDSFCEVQELINSLVPDSFANPEMRKWADGVYGFRLAPGSTLGDLLVTDVFGSKTENQDIPCDRVLKGIAQADLDDRIFRLDTYHFMAHRPQRTEFLFLHEVIVGYLGNRLQNQGRILERAELSQAKPDYWALPAYITVRLAELLGRSEADIVSLHLGESAFVREHLPPAVQELMMISSHLSWYMDLLAKLSRGYSPSDILSLLYRFFVIPSIEMMKQNPRVRLKLGSGKFTDRLLSRRLLGVGCDDFEFPKSSEVASLFQGLVDEVWVRPKANPARRRLTSSISQSMK